MKRFFAIFLLCLAVIFAFVGCGDKVCDHTDDDSDGVCDGCAVALGCSHTDSNYDGECDECGAIVNEELLGDLALVKDGDALFSVLVASDASSTLKGYVNDFIRELNQYYIEDGDVIESYDAPGFNQTTEIIIGPVASRGAEFDVETRYLGYEGFAVRVVGKKLFLIAGGNTGYRRGIEYVKENVLKLEEFEDYVDELVLKNDIAYEHIQTDYDIEEIKIVNYDVSRYVIAYGDTLSAEKSVATAVRDETYRKTGVWLELVKIRELDSAQPAIFIEYTGGDEERTTDGGFVIYVDGLSNLRAECEFADIFEDTVKDGLTSLLLPNQSKVRISPEDVYTRDVRNIYYEDFGAKGDGVTNDFEAIKACHDHANEYGYTANAKGGSTYYIGKTSGKTVTVRTSTKWNGAKFIIDDLCFEKEDAERNTSIFTIKSDHGSVTYRAGDGTDAGEIIDAINAAGGIEAESCTKLDLGLGYPAILVVYNNNHENYIRYGSHYEGGGAQHEIVSVDAEGNIDPDTRFMFDYTEITHVVVFSTDDAPITVDGGGATFTTVANQVPFEWNGTSPVYYYYKRNVSIERSNTVFKNVNHLVTGERDDCGAPYSGFISVSYTNNVLVRDCTVTGHKNYNNMGSYDLSPGNSNNVTFLNVNQTNFFLDDGVTVSTSGGYWGIMGSNYCKNMTYDGCTLTRFDAHKGVYNATIRNSTVGTLTLIGMGTFKMENSTVYAGSRAYLISLRSDYGSTWTGDFILKDVNVVYTGNSNTFTLMSGSWNNHYFGYACSAPATVTVDNLTVSSSTVSAIRLASGSITNSGISDKTEGNKNPYTTTGRLTVRNNTKNYSFSVPQAYATEIVYE